MFFESNPIPAKTALHLMGKMEAELRLPLCSIGTAAKEKLTAVLRQLKLI